MPKVLVVPVGEAPRVEVIPPGLIPLQKLVGGYIEAVPLAPNVDAFCNEEGRILGLPRNRWIDSVQQYVCGPIVVSRHNEEGEATDLTAEDIRCYLEEFACPSST